MTEATLIVTHSVASAGATADEWLPESIDATAPIGTSHADGDTLQRSGVMAFSDMLQCVTHGGELRISDDDRSLYRLRNSLASSVPTSFFQSHRAK